MQTPTLLRRLPAAAALACASSILSLVFGVLDARAEDPFTVQVIESLGRTVTAELADVDGGGRQDLVQAVTSGMPPDEKRVVRVYPQQAGGWIPSVFVL